jgi:hypothetical protein
MLTDLLETLGLFMGKRQNENQEALFFCHLNKWLMRQSGGEWDQPELFDRVMADAARRGLFTDFLRYVLKTPRAVSFLGWLRYLRYRSPANLDVPWGWKDPRSTFTLPIWLDLFPDAKVLHIYRNGVDVANSLRVRSQNGLAHFGRWRQLHRRLAFSWWNQLSPKLYVRNFTLEEGFALWETYTRRADEHIAILPAERTKVIQYESFQTEPLAVMQELCDFVGVPARQAVIQQALASINPARASAYEHDDELRQFYEQVRHSAQMRAYGY